MRFSASAQSRHNPITTPGIMDIRNNTHRGACSRTLFPRLLTLLFAVVAGCIPLGLHAQVPQLLNYQGRVAVGAVNFDGGGQFKFALVNATGSITYWSNDGSSTAGSEPAAAVALTVTKGLYSVLLGDTTLANMTAIPASVFTNTDVRLRVWFDDGVNGFQLLTPDQRIAAVGYAMVAGSVPNGSITGAMIASGAVGANQIAPGATAPRSWQPTRSPAQISRPAPSELPKSRPARSPPRNWRQARGRSTTARASSSMAP